jgi:hypothetical protein
MQQEHGRDGVQVGRLVLVLPAVLLAAAVGWAVALVLPVAEEVRCLGFWDDGTKVAVSPAWRSDACRWFRRSPCYPAGFSDAAPVRHVFFDPAPLDLLRVAYAPEPGGGGAGIEQCGVLASLKAESVPAPERLLASRLKEARVELRPVDGKAEVLTRSGERFPCGKGRSWCWIGPSHEGGVPVVRAHLVQASRVTITLPRHEGERRLDLRFGFTDESERLRATLLGFARLRVLAGGRVLYSGLAWPGLGDRGGRVNLAAVPAGGNLDLVLEGLGSRFGEMWVFGRFAP